MSIFDGLSVDVLQARLTAMQTAYLELVSGAKLQVASYSQVTGSQTVTYTQANIADLTAAILAVQSAMDVLNGVTTKRRTPLVPYWRGGQ